MTIDVSGKVAMVTGAATGIGLACAQTLADAGAKVMITDIRVDACEAATASITEAGGVAQFRHLDVTSEQANQDVRKFLDELASEGMLAEAATAEETDA